MFFILRTIAHFFDVLRTFSSRSYENIFNVILKTGKTLRTLRTCAPDNIFTAILKSPFYCALCALAHLTIKKAGSSYSAG